MGKVTPTKHTTEHKVQSSLQAHPTTLSDILDSRHIQSGLDRSHNIKMPSPDPDKASAGKENTSNEVSKN